MDLKPRSVHSGCYEIEKKVTRNMNELRKFYSLDLNKDDDVPWTKKGDRLPVSLLRCRERYRDAGGRGPDDAVGV